MLLPVLYSFRRCPYAMRARLALALAGVELELREVVLKAKPESMLQYSPKGTVPVLVLPDKTVIDESIDIAMWALGDAFTPAAKRLFTQCDGDFKTNLDRYKYWVRAELRAQDKDANYYRDAGLEFLQELDKALVINSDEPLTWECMILPFVRQYRGVDEAWFDQLPLANLQRRLQLFLGSDLFKRVMAKYPQWHEGDQPSVLTL